MSEFCKVDGSGNIVSDEFGGEVVDVFVMGEGKVISGLTIEEGGYISVGLKHAGKWARVQEVDEDE